MASKTVPVFREQLERGVWDVIKDISLRTWFVSLCVLRFPATYGSVRRLSQHAKRTVEA